MAFKKPGGWTGKGCAGGRGAGGTGGAAAVAGPTTAPGEIKGGEKKTMPAGPGDLWCHAAGLGPRHWSRR